MKLFRKDIHWIITFCSVAAVFLSTVNSGHDLGTLFRNFWFELGVICLLVSLVADRWNLPPKLICLAFFFTALGVAFLPFVIGSYANAFFFIWLIAAFIALITGYCIAMPEPTERAKLSQTLLQKS